MDRPELLGYIFSFLGSEKKLEFFAINMSSAQQLVSCHPVFSDKQVVDIKCFRPVKNHTVKDVLNGKFLWVAEDSPDGWRKLQGRLN